MSRVSVEFVANENIDGWTCELHNSDGAMVTPATVESGSDGLYRADFSGIVAAQMPAVVSAVISSNGQSSSVEIRFVEELCVAGKLDGAVEYAYDSSVGSRGIVADGYWDGYVFSAVEEGERTLPNESGDNFNSAFVSSASVTHGVCEQYVVEGVKKDGDIVFYLLPGEKNGLSKIVPNISVASELIESGCYLGSTDGLLYVAKNIADDIVVADASSYCKCVRDGSVVFSSDVSVQDYQEDAKNVYAGDFVICAGEFDNNANQLTFSDDAGKILEISFAEGVINSFNTDPGKTRLRFSVRDPGFLTGITAKLSLAKEFSRIEEQDKAFCNADKIVGLLLGEEDTTLDGEYDFDAVCFDKQGRASLLCRRRGVEMVHYPSGIDAVSDGNSVQVYCSNSEGMVSLRKSKLTGLENSLFSPSAVKLQVVTGESAELGEDWIDPVLLPGTDDLPSFAYETDNARSFVVYGWDAEFVSVKVPFGGSIIGESKYERIAVSLSSGSEETGGQSILNGTYLMKKTGATGFDRVYTMTTDDATYQIRSENQSGQRYWLLVEQSEGSPKRRLRSKVAAAATDSPARILSSYYAYDESGTTLNTSEELSGSFVLSAAEPEHGYSRTMKMRLYDKYRNFTDEFRCAMTIWSVAPEKLSISLSGADGLNHYAGYMRTDHGLFPCEYVFATISAESELAMTYEISGDSFAANFGRRELPSATEKKVAMRVRTNERGFFDSSNGDAVQANLKVMDEAGNVAEEVATLPFFRRLFKAEHENLLEEGANYSHRLYRSESASDILISPTTSIEGSFVRAWNEIWWPERHAPPLNEDGSVDAEAALAAAKSRSSSDTENDYLAISSDGSELEVDEDGRYVQGTWSNEIQYGPMVNNAINGERATYWVIDNTGWPDVQLEFEYFDFDEGVATLPANLGAPASGDMLVVYDASNPEALDENNHLRVSSKLVQLFILKGSYRSTAKNRFVMTGSGVVGNLTEKGNGFVTPIIDGVTKLCLIPYTDNGGNGSGFKLKAGPRHSIEYRNYDTDDRTGEVWVHVAPTNTSLGWLSPQSVSAAYQYYLTRSDIDPEKGEIVFRSPLPRTLLGTFTAMPHLPIEGDPSVAPKEYFSPKGEIRAFAFSQDDFVDYLTPVVAVVPHGAMLDATKVYNKRLGLAEGKISTGYSLEKDTGILEFLPAAEVPAGRLLGSYYHHSFYRLTSDGYGDLYYYGSGTLYPMDDDGEKRSWAYVDVKLVNEGTNTLNSGTLQFLARGYVTGGSVVDQVLDMNRPWDVQEGSVGETVNRTGAKYSTRYANFSTGDYVANLANAVKARGNQTCTFGTLAPKGRVFVRIFWTIATNANGGAWISCTRGRKLYSAEISGTYFLF